MPRLEAVISAALQLARAAVEHDDNVGLMVFADTVQRYVAPARGRRALRAVLEGLAARRGSAGRVRLSGRVPLSRRAQPEARADGALHRRHRPDRERGAGGARGDPPAPPPAARRHAPGSGARGARPVARPGHSADAFERAAAEELLGAREAALAEMRGRGVMVLDVPPAAAAARRWWSGTTSSSGEGYRRLGRQRQASSGWGRAATNASTASRIELGARHAPELGDGGVGRTRVAVGALGGHRVEGVGHRDDARLDRESSRRGGRREIRGRRAARGASGRSGARRATRCASGSSIRSPSSGMLGDLAELVVGERAGLVQHRLAGADLPDVVQLAAQPDAVEAGRPRSRAAGRCPPRTGSPGSSARGCRRPWPRARGPASARPAGTAPGSAGPARAPAARGSPGSTGSAAPARASPARARPGPAARSPRSA